MALGRLAFSGTGAGPATAAEDCPRSFLDERYCDRDGHLTADLPVDEGEWVDPDTIIFSYTPVEDPSVYKNIWDGFIEHMTAVTGKKVAFFPVQSNAAPLEALRSGRLRSEEHTSELQALMRHSYAGLCL